MDPLVPLSIYFLSISNITISRILLILLLIILGAFFSCAETAFSQCNRFKIAAHADAGKKNAKYALKILDKFDNSIITLLICINVVHILCSAIATILAISLMPKNDELATLLSTIVLTIVVFLFSEMIPKSFANQKSDELSEIFAIPIYFISIILTPLSLFFRFIVLIIKKIFKVSDEENQMTEDDFQDIVEDIQEEGHLEEEESELIQAAVDFGDFTVKDVMTPVDKMVCFDMKESSQRSVLNFLKTTNYSRIPVYEESTNNIIGILHVKKYLLAISKEKNYFSFKSILSKPVFVQQNIKLDDMIDLFQENHTHIAIIIDNNKNVIGMLTMEDAVEKLVGDIDEKNPPKVVKGGNR